MVHSRAPKSDAASGQASDAGHMRRVRVCSSSAPSVAVFFNGRWCEAAAGGAAGGVSHRPNSTGLLWRKRTSTPRTIKLNSTEIIITKLVLLAPPLSICHAAGTQTCTRLDRSRRYRSAYVPDCLWTVLDQLPGVRRSRIHSVWSTGERVSRCLIAT